MANKKETILKTILRAAKLYKEHLLNTNIMFVYRTKDKIWCLETTYLSYNFKHLTGVKSSIPANKFFSMCVNNKLTVNDFELAENGTSVLKADVICDLMNITSCAKMKSLAFWPLIYGNYLEYDIYSITYISFNIVLGFQNLWLSSFIKPMQYYPQTYLSFVPHMILCILPDRLLINTS